MRTDAPLGPSLLRNCARRLRLERRRLDARGQRRGGWRRAGRLPGHDRAQVRLDHDRVRAERVVVAGLREQDALLALGDRSGGHERVVRQASRCGLPVGEGRARRRARSRPSCPTDRRLQIERIAAQRPDLILGGLLRDDEEGVRDALGDRPGRGAAQGQGRLRLHLAGGDADQRQGGRPAGAGARARGRDRAADRGRRRRAPRVRGADSPPTSPTTRGSSCTALRTSARTCSSSSASPIRRRCARRSRTTSAASSPTRRSTRSTSARSSGSPTATAPSRSSRAIRSTASSTCARRVATCSSAPTTACTRRPRSRPC